MLKYSRQAKPAVVMHTFAIETLSHEGRGVSHYHESLDHPIDKHGKKVFVQFALPNERVLAKITRQSKRFEEAEAVSLVSSPSVYRTTPICEHFTVCGGCSLQHMQADEQIRVKQNTLASHLQHFSGLAPEEWLAPVRSTRQDYRRRARIGVRYVERSKKLVMGFRERQSNHLVSIQHCPILDVELNQALPDLYQMLSHLKGCKDIGHIELSMGSHEIALLVRHTAALQTSDVQQLKQFAQHKTWQLYLQPKDSSSVHRIDQKAPMRLSYHLTDFNLELGFSPTDFTQVNDGVNQQMIKLACKLLNLQAGERVLDLFCGLGNFSLPLAQHVGEHGCVVAVEGSENMVARGQENAKRNHIKNIEFYAQDLTQDFSKQPWAKQAFDALLIDPPRTGAEQVMQYIAHFSAQRIVYVSCDPATLARDAGILAQKGYALKKAGVMDMFTHTSHVESITLFEKVQSCNNKSE
ncbi:23S rRNA (uracil(1939)-C(5))-methyltransferase RlmD [Acinetobacter sp. B5B]|uniref:23S rRNA (uracil(1939)-C(5))-methyltransferase RlmD n=1 Tax=Acinetobacter baretiae TaxID=2605383 RepID=UPI0018C23DCE|nr:23S rRNA (uracil(1939)-C(5))-methyltransferase RlmD [Acinetobacter baretiae]MBF7683604.1 23S rRNA (uracil(1939)-C(5))-methyltransferase RlmD [Acinetobacter baretiae]